MSTGPDPRRRPIDTLRPNRAIREDMDFLHVANHAGLNRGGADPQLRVGRTLIAHLGRDFVLCRPDSPNARASEIAWVSGFCVKQALPIFIAIAAAGAWLWSGVLTVTASISLPTSSNILRKS